MRWQGQQVGAVDAAALPGLDRWGDVVRTVTTPDFAGVTFHEVMAKSALNRVPGPSAMPFDWTVNPYRGCTHACTYCLAPETLVLLGDGRQRPLADLRVGDEIVGTQQTGTYRRYVRTTVRAAWRTRKRAHRVTLADGTEIVASGDHRFLTERGWKHVTGTMSGDARRPFLTTGNHLIGFGTGALEPDAVTADDADYRRGYLSGMIRGDGMIFHRAYTDAKRTREIHRFRLALIDVEALDRTRRFLAQENIRTSLRPFASATATRSEAHALHNARAADVARIEELVRTPATASRGWSIGFLAGIFDAEGSCSRGVVRISNKDAGILDDIEAALGLLDVSFVREPTRPNGVATVRLVGGAPTRQRFFRLVEPAITRKLVSSGGAVKTAADLRIVSIDDLGVEIEMVDITTGTGDFIANGVVSHNCFARGTHEYLDLDAGRDFDSQIIVKLNVADVLRRELSRPSWRHEQVALGTNTDPYQRAEGRYRLMPDIIDALVDSGTPFSILTKGTLLRRDLPQLAAAAAAVPIDIAMSIAVLDEPLRQLLEAGAPTFAARLDTVRAATAAGFRVTVFLMPIVPHLTDSVEALDAALARIADAGAARVIYGAMHLRPGVKPWFQQWLARERPDLVPAYRGLYPGASVQAPQGYRRMLAARVRPLLRRHRLRGGLEEDEAVPSRFSATPVVVTSRGRRAAADRAIAASAPTLF